MVYESEITFTLDTICPWTYLARKRLGEALRQFRESPDADKVNFTIKYLPFQLNPEATQEGKDKYKWYMEEKWNNDPERMKMFTTLMTAYGTAAGINFNFNGTVANTLHAHRLIQHYQTQSGPVVADSIVSSLYRQYFEEAAHPSSHETLLKAATEAGVPEDEARKFVEDEDEELMDVKMLIREQAGNGVDAVPYVVIEGRRRDITVQGAKEPEEFLKELRAIAKEAS